MNIYNELVLKVLEEGTYRHEPRTDTDILSLFGVFLEIDMSNGFPLLTSKKMAFNTMAVELEWFINGRSDLKYLLERNCNIWTGDAFRAYGSSYAKYLGVPIENFTIEMFRNGVLYDDEYFDDGCDLGPIYGTQWRGSYDGITSIRNAPPDQLYEVVESLKKDPFARRHIVMAWNPVANKDMVLPPCHMGFQLYMREVNGQMYLDLLWMQRSADIALGIPFNIGSYALLLELIAKEVGALGGFLKASIGDAHIYASHVENLKKQVTLDLYPLPKVDISQTSLWDFDASKVKLIDYKSHDRVTFKLYN